MRLVRWVATVPAALFGAVVWFAFAWMTAFSVCDPGAPFFCTSTTASQRHAVLAWAVASGAVASLPVWVAPVKLPVKAAAAVLILLLATAATLYLADVGLDGCRTSPVGLVSGC